MDTMREFGAMALASRLRRLSDRLKSEATRIYQENGLEFNDSQFIVALMLCDRDGVSVSEIADACRVSPAAISQMAGAMERKGHLVGRPYELDKRRTLLYLTRKGRSTIEALRPIWNLIGECTEELLASTGMDLLLAVSEIEEHLDRRSLHNRVTERMNKNCGRMTP